MPAYADLDTDGATLRVVDFRSGADTTDVLAATPAPWSPSTELADSAPAPAPTCWDVGVETRRRTTGEFEVSFEPLDADDEVIGRMKVLKTFTGGLTGQGVGHMLSIGTAIDNSAGYVAIERITGDLEGRRGGFALQHAGLVHRGASRLVVTVVPDSGTDDLLGLCGEFTIENLGAVHHYAFDYAIEAG